MDDHVAFMQKLITTEDTIPYLQEKGVIRREPPVCPVESCQRAMTCVKRSDILDGYIWRCHSHKGRKTSIRNASFLANQNIELRQFCFLAYLWAFSLPGSTQCILTGLSEHSVIQWNQYLRDICSRWLDEHPMRLGGVGKIVEIGVKSPTPVQSNCIPKILEGRNCIGIAKTGSGKTLAFALPIIQKLSEEPYGIFALVLTPTRELAYQIAEQFALLGKPISLKYCVVVGRMDMMTQGLELSKKPHIVIATPGRLADHLETCNTFSLAHIKYIVLDEADRLLSGDFDKQMETIFSFLPKQRQNLLFSATMNDTLHEVDRHIGKNCFIYEAPSTEAATVDTLEQSYLLCPRDVKDAYLIELIRVYQTNHENGNIIIFVDTCKKCQVLSSMLNNLGFENVALHGMIPKQQQRLAALTKFKSNTVKILLATDVASRGLDIPTVELVINYILPVVPKEYIHRVGRTARAGRSGKAISLIIPQDIPKLKAIEGLVKASFTEYKLDDSEVSKIFPQVLVTKSEAYIQLDETDFYEKSMINKRKKWILKGLDPEEEEQKLLLRKRMKGKTKKTLNHGIKK